MKSKVILDASCYLRVIFRRDRIRLILWPLLFTILLVYSAWSLVDLLPDQAAIETEAEILKNPFTIATSGPGYGLDAPNLGVILAHKSFLAFSVIVAVMSISLTVRYTRREESAGYSELFRSTALNRHAGNLSALLIVTAFNLAIWLLSAVGLIALGIDGITSHGSFLFGAAFAGVGLTFMGMAALVSQFTASSRSATMLSVVVLVLFFGIRAIGDLGSRALSWFSPLGWAQATQPYANETWLPLLLCLICAAGLVLLAFRLSEKRDFGAGLIRSRERKETVSKGLLSPHGLAFRLQRGSLIGWMAGMAVFAIAFGTLTGIVVEYMNDPNAFLLGVKFVDEFFARMLQFIAFGVALYGIASMSWLNREEKDTHLELIVSTNTTRRQWFLSHSLIAIAGSAAMIVLASLFFGLASAGTTGDGAAFPRILLAGISYIPAVWAVIGIAALVYGFVRRAGVLPYIVLVYSLVLSLFASGQNIPGWMLWLSPFGKLPFVPYESFQPTPVLLLLGIGILFVTAGFWGFRNRDVKE
jgi:ABC-2 type transport system permease protein